MKAKRIAVVAIVVALVSLASIAIVDARTKRIEAKISEETTKFVEHSLQNALDVYNNIYNMYVSGEYEAGAEADIITHLNSIAEYYNEHYKMYSTEYTKIYGISISDTFPKEIPMLDIEEADGI